MAAGALLPSCREQSQDAPGAVVHSLGKGHSRASPGTYCCMTLHMPPSLIYAWRLIVAPISHGCWRGLDTVRISFYYYG